MLPSAIPNAVAIDFEATGLNVWRGARMFSAAASFMDGTDRFWRGDFSGLKELLADESVDKVFHNMKYDLRIAKWAGLKVRGRCWDTMIFYHLLDGRMAETGLGLGDLAVRFLPSDQRKVIQELTDWFDKHKIGKNERYEKFGILPPDMLKRRNVGDARLTLSLFKRAYTTVVRTFPFLLEQEHKLAHVVGKLEERGVEVDPEEIERQMDRFERIVENCTEFCEGVIGRNEFNLNSKADQEELLDRCGLLNQIMQRTKPSKTFPKGQKKLDDYNLRSLHHPVPHMLLLGKAANKMRNTFLAQMLREQVNCVLHANMNQLGTVASRFCVAKGAQIQVPSGTKPIEDVRIGDLVYCYDDSLKLRLRKVTNHWYTGRKQIVRIHWQGNRRKLRGYLDVTPDHRIRTAHGNYIQAQCLQPGTKLMALHRARYKSNPYNMLYATHAQARKEAVVVCQEIHGSTGDLVHHRNRIKHDDRPDNLEPKTHKQHAAEHRYDKDPESYRADKQRAAKASYEARKRNGTLSRKGEDSPGYRHVSKENLEQLLKLYDNRPTKVAAALQMDYLTLISKLNKYSLPYRRRDKNIDKETLIQLLIQCQGQPTKMAKALGVTYGHIIVQLKKNYLDWRDYRCDNRNYSQSAFAINNHRVIRIELLETRVATYDLEIEGESNFIANEICVHNSCSKPNLQNIPIEGDRRTSYTEDEAAEALACTWITYAPHLKRIFKVREGKAHIHSDKKQAEMAMVAHYTDDPILKGIFNEGQNFHEGVCRTLYNEVTKGLKTRTKAVVFGFIFGAGNPQLAKKIGSTLQVAIETRKRLEKALPSLPRWKRKLEAEINERGYVQTIHGRRHYLRSDEAYITVNRMCQGTVADEIKSRMVAIDDYLVTEKLDATVIMQIHDDIATEINKEDRHKTVPEIHRIMHEASMPFNLTLPASLDITYTRWSDLKEIDNVREIPGPPDPRDWNRSLAREAGDQPLLLDLRENRMGSAA